MDEEIGTKLNQAWSALAAVLKEAYSFYGIKEVMGLAGLDVTRLAHLVQRSGGATKGELITALDGEIGSLDNVTKQHVLNHLAETIVTQRPYEIEQLQSYLDRLGWQLVDGRLIPIELFDVDELAELPQVARKDIAKAASRLRDGDLGGALAAACGAVDSSTAEVYCEYGLGPPKNDSFQQRCSKALKAKGVIEEVQTELTSIGWQASNTDMLANNLKGALNQSAYVMQTLRSEMSDVHGSQQVVSALVFDSLKWAALLVRMLK